jgi:cobalt/nickel transport system permease protein
MVTGVLDNLFNLGQLDRLARGDSVIHRFDSRAKVLTVLLFIVVVASYDRYAVIGLLPLFLFPMTMLLWARLPRIFFVKRLLLVAPCAIFIGIFNPLFDHQFSVSLGPLVLSSGWISFVSIILRFLLTIGISLVLVAVTGFPGICDGLARLGVPRIFVLQLLFLYRYIFVLGDEAGRMVRARSLRSFGQRGQGVKVYGAMLAQLLLRTIDRAKRVHVAMLGRGFVGEFHLLSTHRFRCSDLLFVCGWSLFFILVRLFLGDL